MSHTAGFRPVFLPRSQATGEAFCVALCFASAEGTAHDVYRVSLCSACPCPSVCSGLSPGTHGPWAPLLTFLLLPTPGLPAPCEDGSGGCPPVGARPCQGEAGGGPEQTTSLLVCPSALGEEVCSFLARVTVRIAGRIAWVSTGSADGKHSTCSAISISPLDLSANRHASLLRSGQSLASSCLPLNHELFLHEKYLHLLSLLPVKPQPLS